MTRRKKNKKKPTKRSDDEPPTANAPGTPGSNQAAAPAAPAAQVAVGGWKERKAPARRTFPGPRGVAVPLRVAVERAAYAEVIAHAKDSLQAEICGVLAGEVCEDDDGLFVHVQAAVRGSAAKEGTVHVTYTQETWNLIHQAMERDHPRLEIVGWYHSHPGFGVEFSDMDLFIQKNFFAGPGRIGLVTDPLGGDVAVMANTAAGLEHLDRIWVDAREHRLRLPAKQEAASAAPAAAGGGGVSQKTIEALETRLSQLVRTVDDLRNSLYRFLLLSGIMVGVAVCLAFGYSVYRSWSAPIQQPEGIAFTNVVLPIDGKPSLLGVKLVRWRLPPEIVDALKAEAAKEEQKGDVPKPDEKQP